VIDHDESTYLEIARMMLSGKTLYVDMVDIKPPGIFLILAGFQAVFGHSIFMMRMLVALWIAITAFIIYKTGKLLVKDDRAALAAGIIYIFFISTWSFYGISITPEIFFNLFTITALYVLLKNQTPLYYLLAGLIAGMGFMVKYLVISDFAAFLVFFIILEYRKNNKPKSLKVIFSLILAGTGFFLPFALANLLYYLNGHFDAFFNIIYLAPGRYPSAFDPWKMLKYVLSFHLLFLPVFFFFYYSLLDKQKFGHEFSLLKKFHILWSLMALAAVLAAGKTFGHYTIQLMLPVSMMAGLFFHSERRLPDIINRPYTRKYGRIILFMLILLITMMKLEYILRRDMPREVAGYLKPRLKAGDIIYAGNYHHILYYLLQKDSPTKYIHRSLLLETKHIKALDIKVDEEFRQIMAQRPVYIITEKEYPKGDMKDFIDNNYNVEMDFGEGVLVLRLKKL
jgi:4-amino-4-deoxy-L-arabinose transferase-like glycosyltransferase